MKIAPVVLAVTLIALVPVSNPLARAQMPFTTIALSGQPAPGIPGATIASVRDSIVTGPAGHVALWASFSGPGISHSADEALWVGRPGSLQLVARANDPAPEVDDHAVFSNFSYETVVNSTGQVAFRAAIVVRGVDDEVPDYAIYAGSPGSLKLLARSARTVPELDTTTRIGWDLRPLAYNASGQVALIAGLFSDTPDAPYQQGVLVGAPGSLKFIAKTGQQAPGFPQGLVYHGYASDGDDFAVQRLTDAGRVLFAADVIHPDSTDTPRRAFWTGTPGSVQRLVYDGQPAPSIEPNRVIRYPTLSTNASAQMVLVCGLSDSPANDPSESALYVGTPDTLRLIARTGQQAPGMPPAVTYQAFFYNSIISPVINDTGIIAFSANLHIPGTPEGFIHEGLWLGPPDHLKLIAAFDQRPPGLPDGFDFYGFEPQLNNLGQLIFRAWFQAPGPQFGAGVWTLDPSGNPTLLFADGHLFDVGNGDFRTITRFQLGQLNDLGQLPFWASFSDGSAGLFIATIPEPATLSLLPLSALMLLRRLRCRVALISLKKENHP